MLFILYFISGPESESESEPESESIKSPESESESESEQSHHDSAPLGNYNYNIATCSKVNTEVHDQRTRFRLLDVACPCHLTLHRGLTAYLFGLQELGARQKLQKVQPGRELWAPK